MLCLQALEVGNEPLKVRALECLGTLDPQVAEQVAMKYLSDSKAELRAAAVVAVAGLPKDEVLEAIVGFLEDTKEVWASVKMCLGLRKFAHPGITSRFERELKKAIADWDAVPGPMPQTKNKPAKTAAKPRVSGQERERKRLQERIVRLVNELCCSPDRQATADMLIGLASHPVADLRFAAVLGLGTAGTGQWKKVVPVLTAALKDKNPAVIDAATAALGHLAPESAEAVSELLKVIQNDKLKVELRMAAARGASNAPNDRRVLPMFMQMIKQDGGPVVWNSMTTLDPSGAQAIPAMIALLTSKKPELVSGALAVLIRYREKAAAARSAVAALLEHKSQRIRTQANALLNSRVTMSKSAAKPKTDAQPEGAANILRMPAEMEYAHELEALKTADKGEKPEGWLLSPRSVRTYVLGGKANGVEIRPKYLGSERVVEIAIATLATDRALLLIGEPGTAKSWLSEHLAAAISGDSLQIVQGTAGTTEEQIRYSWNYALLLAEGPSPKALVPSPVFRAFELGKLVRFEEITRTPSEVQDSLITLLSEKILAVPELNIQVPAKRGFNLIGTANTRDRGVNDMSAALKRRFNFVVLPVPSDVDTEVQIVQKRVAEIGSGLRLPAPPPAEEAVRKIVQIFQDLRRGQTLDGKQKIKPPSGALSTAEAISLLNASMSLAGHFGNGKVSDRDLAAGLQGVVIKEDSKDAAVWVEYLENVMKKRGAEWRELYSACKELV